MFLCIIQKLKMFLFFFTLTTFSGYCNEIIDCVISGYDDKNKDYLLTLFLPHNPRILSFGSNPEVKKVCDFWWPKNSFFYSSSDLEQACDLIWIDHTDKEIEILKGVVDKLFQAKVIYTVTPTEKRKVRLLKSFLTRYGFTLLGHWYKENIAGHAIFVKKELFGAAMNTLNYSPSNSVVESSAFMNNLDNYFKKVDYKSSSHKIEGIDFIYMINLDERPEKFAASSEMLEKFGIYPYRFSAVNGWKLTTDVINQVGVKFDSDFKKEKFLGSIYREIDGKEYLGNEILKPNGETFFSLGMSRGAIGIVLSHLSVLQDAYNSGYKTIWVMEDDIEVIKDPSEISKLIPKLDQCANDWDILFTDKDTKDHNGNPVPCRAIMARPNVKIPPLDSFLKRFYPVNADFSRIGMRYGAYSFIIRRSGMEKILNYFKTYGIFIPWDIDMWMAPGLKIYSLNKDLISHKVGSPSDNSYPNYAYGICDHKKR